MNLELFILGGYGLFVWPAFIFTFASCLILYIKIKKELNKKEKKFLNELEKIQVEKMRNLEEKKTVKEVASVSTI